MEFLRTAQHLLAGLGFHGDLQMFLALFGLAFARMVTAISLAPFMGGQVVAGRIKVGLAVIATFVMAPYLGIGSAANELNAVVFFAMLVKEVMIGAVIGLTTQFVFYAIQMAGVLMDTQRGMNQMSFFAPQLPGNTSILGQLQFQAALTLMLTLNGHLFYLRALHSSFDLLPILSFPHFGSGIGPFADQLIRITANAFLIALQIAAPVLLALFLIDVAFGVIGKMASQINVHSESQPVKALAGLGVLFVSIGFLISILQGKLAGMLADLNSILRGLR